MNKFKLLRLMVVAAVIAVNLGAGLFPLGDDVGGGGILFRLLRAY